MFVSIKFWRSTDRDRPSDVANEENADGERERDLERRKGLKSPLNRRSSGLELGRRDSDREILFEDIEEVRIVSSLLDVYNEVMISP